jgi:hypothetical protein
VKPQQKITFREMRASGIRNLLIYCSDYHCSPFRFPLAQKSPGRCRGSSLLRRLEQSVGNGRAAIATKTVIEAHRDHIHGLVAMKERTVESGSGRYDRDVL